MVFSNNASNQDNNHNDSNSSNQNSKAHKEAMSLLWTSMIQYPSDDKTNPAYAGFYFYPICCSAGVPAFKLLKRAVRNCQKRVIDSAMRQWNSGEKAPFGALLYHEP